MGAVKRQLTHLSYAIIIIRISKLNVPHYGNNNNKNMDGARVVKMAYPGPAFADALT